MSPSTPQDAPLDSLDDRELMDALTRGRQDALAELYDRHSSTLLGLTTRILRNPGDAEEIVQEVFVHAWDRASSYDPSRSSVSTWLVLIARSRAIDRLRSQKVVDRTTTAVKREKSGSHASPEGAASVLHQERRQRVQEALAEIPEEQRQVLELAFYGGMTQSEIAKKTGIPLGTVKTRTLLAMKKLRKALGDEISELL